MSACFFFGIVGHRSTITITTNGCINPKMEKQTRLVFLLLKIDKPLPGWNDPIFQWSTKKQHTNWTASTIYNASIHELHPKSWLIDFYLGKKKKWSYWSYHLYFTNLYFFLKCLADLGICPWCCRHMVLPSRHHESQLIEVVIKR